MEEWRFEFACAKACGRRYSVVHPRLLQDVSASGSSVDAQVVVQSAEGCAGETEDGIRHGKARVSHIVLIIRFVQALVVIVVVLPPCLHEEVRLEDELAVARLKRKASVVRNAKHAVFHVDVLCLLLQVSAFEVVFLERYALLFLVLRCQTWRGEEGS